MYKRQDPISAFGGIVSCNYKITQKIAVMLNKIFLEVIVANGFDKKALKNNLDSYQSALESDPISAFGGIVSCNYKITQKLAFMLNKIFLEVIVANGFDKKALKILKSK